MERWVIGMRDAFSKALYEIACTDPDVMLITSDTGAICHDDFKNKLTGQYVNVGIAEQNMVGVASGVALAGKKVFVYAIVPFATMRCYEQIRVDLCCMDLPVTVVGVGAGFDYSTLGPTHHGTEDISLMRALPGMRIYSPSDSFMAAKIAAECCDSSIPGPRYIRLDRTGNPLVYNEEQDSVDVASGLHSLKSGTDVVIVATGRMVLTALEVAETLSQQGISAGVVDLFRIKPLNEEKLMECIGSVSKVVALEEHFPVGGIGSAIAEVFACRKDSPELKFVAMPHEFCRQYGKREHLLALNGLDSESVCSSISKWVKD